MWRIQVDRERGEATLFAGGDRVLAAWPAPEGLGHVELVRAHDGTVALAVVDDVITAVRLADGHVVGRGPVGRGIEGSWPLDARWTLDCAGELKVDGGHTGFQGSMTHFSWSMDDESAPDADGRERERARLYAERAAEARRPVPRRWAVRSDAGTALVHESSVAPADGGEVLLWPPVAGPDGVLLRHAVVTDDGRQADEAPQRPWLVRADGTVTQLPFELGVSPLLALPGDRWLLPGWDTVWRDDHDEPLCVLNAAGTTEPLLVGGRPVPVSRLLREAAPEFHDPGEDAPWNTEAARLDAAELRLTVKVYGDEDETLLVMGCPLDGSAPARLLARLPSSERRPGAVVP
jgi:hypothetical protein